MVLCDVGCLPWKLHDEEGRGDLLSTETHGNTLLNGFEDEVEGQRLY